jgi:hypothetical protein
MSIAGCPKITENQEKSAKICLIGVIRVAILNFPATC